VLGNALALASALSWSAANIAIQSASRRFGSWGALVWAQIIGGLLTVVAAAIVHGWPPALDGATALAIAGAGLCAGLAYSGLFESLRLGQVAVVTPIISAWAVVSVAWAVAAGSPLSVLGGLGVALVVLGNAILARTGSGKTSGTPISAIAWAMGSALGFGCMVPLIDDIGAHLGRLWAIPAVWSVELVIGVPILLRQRRLDRPPKSREDWIVAVRTALFEVGGFIALTLALGAAPVTVVSPISSLSTAGSVVLGLIWLRERLRPVTVLGATLACAGVVLVNM
jgi:drug/metabolite transporter (DMT)-like permease